MAGETTITIMGNVTADPEPRHTKTGLTVVNFTIASTPRIFDATTGKWADGNTVFWRCTAWRELAEHIIGSITKGTRVVAFGRIDQRTYTDKNDVQHTYMALTVDDIGPSLLFATATVDRPHTNQHTADGWVPPATETPTGGFYDDTPF